MSMSFVTYRRASSRRTSFRPGPVQPVRRLAVSTPKPSLPMSFCWKDLTMRLPLAVRLIGSLALVGPAGLPMPVVAQAAKSAPPKCDAPEYRQLDFWVGDWNVTVGGGQAGTNLVTLEESGCLVHEHWIGARGETGQSLNFYNRDDRAWHQVWVSSSGNVLDLTGHYVDGTLTYTGENRKADGTALRHRLSFHANPNGTVRQLWESSSDGGATWTVSFDGLYAKRKG